MEDAHSGKLGIIRTIKNLLAAKQNSGDDSLREAIEELIEEEDNNTPLSAVAEHERLLISNILQLRDLPVTDAMVPRADIVSVDIHASKEELLKILQETPRSRIPVCEGGLDNLVGVVYTKDVIASIAAGGDFKMKDIMVEPLVISPAMRVMDLLIQLKRSRVHIAFIVDEFGGIDGLITINDLIEVIVGEIYDEHDYEIEPQIIERSDGTIIADARYDIEDFEERYGDIFKDDEDREDVDTLAGLVINIAGHMPTRGEIIIHEATGCEFYIIDADPRKILRMRIRNLSRKNDSQDKA